MKKKMKNIVLLLVGLLLAASCVDDYTDANPKPRLDAPTIRISASGANQAMVSVPTNRFQTTTQAYISYDGPTEFTVTVVDAPGKVSAVSVTPSVPEFGTVTLNESTVTSLQGQEQGDFKFTFTPNPNLPDESDRPLNLVISVSDSQLNDEGEANPKTTTLTVPTTIVTCVSDDLEEGTYQVTAASGNLDGNVAYTLADLEADNGGPVYVEIESEFPGRYTMNEVTGGIWPVYYPGRARPTFPIDLCGTSVQGHPGATTAGSAPGPFRQFTVTGTLNTNGTVNITWSYIRTDAPTPAGPAKGTFTLTKVD
jgi:hypothetical protein